LFTKNFNNCVLSASYEHVLQFAARYVSQGVFLDFLFILSALKKIASLFSTSMYAKYRTTDQARQFSINICTRLYLLKRSHLGRDNKLHE